MGCCDTKGRVQWGVFALLATCAVVFTSISGPAYFGILAGQSDPKSFSGCAHCVQDFGIEVLKSINATDIINKLEKIHERNEKLHPHHHHHHHHRHHHDEDFEFDEDECITGKDLEDLKPDLEGLVIPDWKEECKDACTPVLKALPLAATVSSVLLFVGLLCGVGAIIPLCMFCCGCCSKEHPDQPHRFVPPMYTAAPSASPVGTHVAGSSTIVPAAVAADASDSAKAPLLTKQV